MRTNTLCFLILTLAVAAAATAQDTDEFYKTACMSCHTIGGGKLTGPDLKDVETRKDREWLIRFIVDPQGVINSGDAYAAKLVEASRGVIMPKAAGIDRERAKKLLDLIAAESKLPRSRFAGVALSDRPFTEKDVEDGRALFTGDTPLMNGGPACISCHAVEGLSGLGGGLLGPDLGDAYARLDGRKALGQWLLNPATPVMAPVYKGHPIDKDKEVLPLLAFLKRKTEEGGRPAPGPGIEFLILGVVGAVIGLLICDAAWKRRFTSVREKVVRGDS